MRRAGVARPVLEGDDIPPRLAGFAVRSPLGRDGHPGFRLEWEVGFELVRASKGLGGPQGNVGFGTVRKTSQPEAPRDSSY